MHFQFLRARSLSITKQSNDRTTRTATFTCNVGRSSAICLEGLNFNFSLAEELIETSSQVVILEQQKVCWRSDKRASLEIDWRYTARTSRYKGLTKIRNRSQLSWYGTRQIVCGKTNSFHGLQISKLDGDRTVEVVAVEVQQCQRCH